MTDYSHLTPENAPLIIVDWEDIYFSDNWDEDGEIVQPRESKTVAYLLEDSESQLVIASSYSWRDDRWATVHAIPKMPPKYITLSKEEVKKEMPKMPGEEVAGKVKKWDYPDLSMQEAPL